MDSIALGREAKGTANQATAVGGKSVAKDINSLAVGFESNAAGRFASALGSGATTDNDFATAVGYGANAAAISATALGEKSTADIAGGVALGSSSKTNVNSGVLGYDPSDKITTQEILLGDNKDTYDNLQTEITTARSNVSSLATQILKLQTEYETANETRRTEIVNEIKSLNTQFLSARADLQDKVSAANKLVSTWQATGAAVSVGNSETGLTRQITNVAAGSEDTDAVNVAQLTSLSDKVDANKISYVSINTKRDANKDNDQAGVPDDKSSRDAAVIGSNNITTGLGNWNLVATGFGNTIKNISYDAATDSVAEKQLNNTYVYGNENIARNGIAIGRRNVITGDSSSDNIAIGFNNKNYGNRSVNIGNYTLTNGVDSIAVGFSSKARKTDAIAIGGYTEANQVGSIAIGQGAVANTGGLALGYNSLADRSQGSIGYFTTLGSTDQAAIAEKLGKTAEYNQLVTTINGYSGLAAQESQYRAYIRERQNNEDLLSAEIENLYKNPEGSAAYNASLAKIREYQQKIKENNDGENSLSSIVSTNNPDYVKLQAARTELRNMFAAYMSTADAVSVGNVEKGIYRQITGVAAGSEDTDAVNVAQLKDMGSAGLDFKGDGDTLVHRDLGETLNVVGGNTDADSLTDNNIGVVADAATGTLNVKLAKNLTMGDGSITFAPTGKDSEGNTLVQGQDGKWYSDLTDATYDAANNIYTKADGTTVSAVTSPIISAVNLSNTGLDNGNQKITNVAKGVDPTDAVNMEQFNEVSTKVDKGWTLAVGRGPDASSDYLATAKGEATKIAAGDTVTLQAGRGIKLKQDGAAVQIGLKYLDMDSAGSTYNDAVASAGGALAVGQNSVADGQQGVAIGYETHAGQYSFAGGTEAEANNSSVAIGDYAKANNSGSVAIGSGIRRVANDPNSEYKKVDSEYGVAIGYETYVGENSKNSTALGANAKLDSSKYAVAIGNNATVTGSDYATAIGHNTNVINVTNGVALGSYSIVDRGASIVGYDASGANHSNDKTGTWKSGMGEVSVGQNNLTRQITHVAAGSADSDAVNVAQLKAVGSAGLNFKGDDGTIVVHRDLGNTLNVVGGNTDADSLTDNNIGVVADATTGTLNVKLAKNLTMGDGSITFANAKDANGKTLVQGKDGKWYSDLTDATYDATNNVYTKADGTTVSAVENPVVSAVKLTDKGLDNGGNKITNVAAGTVDTDIVNLGQLKGSTIGSSKVEYTDAGAGTVTLTMQDGKEVKINGLKDTYVKEGKLENNTLKFTRNDNTSFEVGDIASKSEMDTAVKDAKLKFTGDDVSEDATITKNNGETLNILGGASEFTTANNIGVVADTDKGTLNVKLAKNISMGDGSVTFAPTGAKDADGNALVQGQDGKWYSDLTDATYDATNNVYTKADGTTVSAVENPVVSSVKLTDKGLDNGGNKITNVAAGTEDTDIVNLGQLKGSTIGSSKVEYTDAGAGTITLTMQDGSKVTIDNLKDTYVSKAKFENNKLTFTRNDDTSFEVGDIASKSEMDTAVKDVNLKFTGDNTDEDATITRKNGETLSVLGGASEFTTANNIGVVKDGEALRVKLAKDVAMGNGSVTFANAKDDAGNTLVQGQDGKWYSDLTDATYDATNNVYTKADGTTIDAVENPTISEVKLSNTGLDNGGNKITNVAAGTEDTDIVNLGQLKGSTIGSSKVEYTDAGAGTITLKMQDGHEVEIGGLQDKYIKGASLDGNKLTITRNDDQKFEVDNIATTADIVGENSKVNLKFTGDDTSDDATITKKNGETLTIYGGVAAKDDDGNSLLTDVNNVGVVKTENGLQIKLAKNLSGIDSARIGGTVANGVATGGIYIANQPVTYNGSAKKTESGLYITGLANTSWNPTTDGIVSGRAATEDQLKAAYDGLSTTITANKVVAGDNITVTELPNGAGTKVSLSDNLAFGDKNGKNIAISGNDAIISAGDGGSNKVVVDGAHSTVTAGTGANQVTVDGTKAGITAGEGANQVAIDGTKGQVTIGEAGEGLVMGNQTVIPKVVGADGKETDGTAQTGKYITGLDNTTWKPDEKGYVADRAATEGQLKDISDSVKNVTDTIGVGTRDFAGDSGEAKVKLGESLNLKGGADVNKLSDGNIGVVGNGSNGLDIKLAKDIKGLDSVETKELTVTEKANIGNVSISNDNVTIGTGDSKTVITNESVTTNSVTTGNTTINNDGLTVKNEDSSKNITVQNNNVSMGGNVIHNVGDGVEATDAINKGQFDRTVNAIGTGMNQMSNRISKLDTRVNRVGAGAAALAALHPLEYNADEKWEISAGVGNYRGTNAVAVGAFYRPNGNTLVSLGTSYGGGENMVNAGVTWRVGEGETGNYSSKQAMAQEISSLKSVVSDQSSQLQAQNSKIEAQSQQLEEQNKKIEQLMQAIAELKK
nr:YadA-like family protein [uncultured Megasphaera sp.]